MRNRIEKYRSELTELAAVALFAVMAVALGRALNNETKFVKYDDMEKFEKPVLR